jgi:hypothetical protein
MWLRIGPSGGFLWLIRFWKILELVMDWQLEKKRT